MPQVVSDARTEGHATLCVHAGSLCATCTWMGGLGVPPHQPEEEETLTGKSTARCAAGTSTKLASTLTLPSSRMYSESASSPICAVMHAGRSAPRSQVCLAERVLWHHVMPRTRAALLFMPH